MAPGTSAGILSTGAFDLNSGASLVLDIGGTTAGTGYDRVNVTGGITLAGELQGSLINGFSPLPADTFFIVINDLSDDISGTFSNAPITNVGDKSGIVLIGSVPWQIYYGADSTGNSLVGGNDVALVIPEPRSWSMLAGSAGMAIGLQRFRRRRA